MPSLTYPVAIIQPKPMFEFSDDLTSSNEVKCFTVSFIAIVYIDYQPKRPQYPYLLQFQFHSWICKIPRSRIVNHFPFAQASQKPNTPAFSDNYL